MVSGKWINSMNKKNIKIIKAILLWGFFLLPASYFLLSAFTGCGKKSSSAQQAGSVMPKPKTKLPEYVPPPPKKKYTYAGNKYRDPLIPAGASYSGASGAEEATEVMTTDKLSTLQLKGILRDEKTGSIAVIADNSGNSYILKKGKVYNKKYKVVQGVAGVVGDKLVTLFSDNTKIELKLKKDKEEK